MVVEVYDGGGVCVGGRVLGLVWALGEYQSFSRVPEVYKLLLTSLIDPNLPE